MLPSDAAGEQGRAGFQLPGQTGLVVRQANRVVERDVERTLVGDDVDYFLAAGIPGTGGLGLVAASGRVVAEDDEVIAGLGEILHHRRPPGGENDRRWRQGGTAALDRAGGPVADLEEAHQPAGLAAARERLTLGANGGEIGSRTTAVFKNTRLAHPQVHD